MDSNARGVIPFQQSSQYQNAAKKAQRQYQQEEQNQNRKQQRNSTSRITDQEEYSNHKRQQQQKSKHSNNTNNNESNGNQKAKKKENPKSAKSSNQAQNNNNANSNGLMRGNKNQKQSTLASTSTMTRKDQKQKMSQVIVISDDENNDDDGEISFNGKHQKQGNKERNHHQQQQQQKTRNDKQQKEKENGGKRKDKKSVSSTTKSPSKLEKKITKKESSKESILARLSESKSNNNNNNNNDISKQNSTTKNDVNNNKQASNNNNANLAPIISDSPLISLPPYMKIADSSTYNSIQSNPTTHLHTNELKYSTNSLPPPPPTYFVFGSNNPVPSEPIAMQNSAKQVLKPLDDSLNGFFVDNIQAKTRKQTSTPTQTQTQTQQRQSKQNALLPTPGTLTGLSNNNIMNPAHPSQPQRASFQPIITSKQSNTTTATPKPQTPTESFQNSRSPIPLVAEDFIPLSMDEDTNNNNANNNANNSKKRKLNTDAPEFRPSFSSKKQKRDDIPPWIDENNPPSTLHNEILNFVDYISPTEAEERMRDDAFMRIKKCILGLWPHCSVHVFGSYESGLCLPLSDIDITVLDVVGVESRALSMLAEAIRKSGIALKMQVIAKARVPIIKMVDRKSLCHIDICLNQPSGIINTKTVLDFIKAMPQLRPLMMTLKYFLHTRDLNETYTGGLGSYALTLTIVSFLQMHQVNNGLNQIEVNLGNLLVDFMEFYGYPIFNFANVGLSVRNGGSYFSKLNRDWFDEGRQTLLAIEDPNDLDNDVGRSSFRIDAIRVSFANAYRTLLSPEKSNPYSWLTAIFPITQPLLDYRALIQRIYK